MSDIKLTTSETGLIDLFVENKDLATDSGLGTAVTISLFTDRRLLDDEALPANTTDRGGFWGDSLTTDDPYPTGSFLWTRRRRCSDPLRYF